MLPSLPPHVNTTVMVLERNRPLFGLLNVLRLGWLLLVLRKHFVHADLVTVIPKAFDTLQLSNTGLQTPRPITSL